MKKSFKETMESVEKELFDVWVVSKTDPGKRFRVEIGLNVIGVANVIRRLRRVYLPEHYSLIRKPTAGSYGESVWDD